MCILVKAHTMYVYTCIFVAYNSGRYPNSKKVYSLLVRITRIDAKFYLIFLFVSSIVTLKLTSLLEHIFVNFSYNCQKMIF